MTTYCYFCFAGDCVASLYLWYIVKRSSAVSAISMVNPLYWLRVFGGTLSLSVPSMQ